MSSPFSHEMHRLVLLYPFNETRPGKTGGGAVSWGGGVRQFSPPGLRREEMEALEVMRDGCRVRVEAASEQGTGNSMKRVGSKD